MRIGIIGAGQIGGTLTRRLAALGHDVSVATQAAPGHWPTWHGRRARKP